jgi:tetratricopeptide (TPR) repeat protein
MPRLALHFMLAVASAVMLPAPSAAHAQPAPSDKAKIKVAKSYVAAGLAAQSSGDYDTAIELYRRAYDLVPHPVLLFNIAQVHRLAGRVDLAVELYQRFLATNPTGAETEIARALLEELEERKVEEARRAQTALRIEAIQVDPSRKSAEAPKARAAAPNAALDTERSGVVDAPAPPERAGLRGSGAVWTTKRKIAVGAAGGGMLVALAVGGALGVSAQAMRREAHTLCPAPQLPCESADLANDLVHSARNRAIGADVAFGVGAAVVVAAGVVWLTGAPESHRRIAVVPATAPKQVVVTLSGRF